MDGDALTRRKTTENSGDNFINVAPGEGQIPSSVLKDKDVDIKTFPHLFPDGKYGMFADRKRKIPYQQYFKQRLYNVDKRFANDPAYLFSAVSYVEQFQLQRNISMSYCHVSKSSKGDGSKEIDVKDPFWVFKDIRNTAKYWENANQSCLLNY